MSALIWNKNVCKMLLWNIEIVCICHKSPVIKYVVVYVKQVTVTAAPSLDYTLTPLSGDQYTSCLCGSERKTLSWTMAPSALGEGQVFIKVYRLPGWPDCFPSSPEWLTIAQQIKIIIIIIIKPIILESLVALTQTLKPNLYLYLSFSIVSQF